MISITWSGSTTAVLQTRSLLVTGIRSAFLLALLGTSSSILFAQDSLERELDFVRALAERMRFIELAKTEVDRLAKEHRGAGDQDRIAQLSVQISYHGASLSDTVRSPITVSLINITVGSPITESLNTLSRCHYHVGISYHGVT